MFRTRLSAVIGDTFHLGACARCKGAFASVEAVVVLRGDDVLCERCGALAALSDPPVVPYIRTDGAPSCAAVVVGDYYAEPERIESRAAGTCTIYLVHRVGHADALGSLSTGAHGWPRPVLVSTRRMVLDGPTPPLAHPARELVYDYFADTIAEALAQFAERHAGLLRYRAELRGASAA